VPKAQEVTGACGEKPARGGERRHTGLRMAALGSIRLCIATLA